MKTEDIKKMAQAWKEVQEAAYGKKAKNEASDTQMGTITVKTDAEREARAKAYRDKKAKNEELKGNQHKIDHNKDGKISAADFKGLRKKAKKDQEVEVQTSEAKIDELSKDTLGRYATKAHNRGDMAARMSNHGRNKDMADIANKRYSGVQKAISKLSGRARVNATEEVELDEGIEKMSHGRLKWHMNTGVPHGSYSKDEMKAERDRRLMHKDSAAAYKKAKAGLSEEVELDELSKKTLASYIATASDDRAKNAFEIGKTGKINTKGLKRRQGINRAATKLAKEAKDHGNMNNGSPAGEGLSPSAKDQLAKKTPAPSDAFDADVVNKKTFDAMRASAKKAPMRTNDNPKGDKNPPKGK